jgi:predicted DNA-binding protein (UPF0251 family)
VGPAGLEAVELSLDEFEALRLADHVGLDQTDAAARMGISRPTFGRILEGARKNLAAAVVEGRTLLIRGGTVRLVSRPGCPCPRCAGAAGCLAGCPRCSRRRSAE